MEDTVQTTTTGPSCPISSEKVNASAARINGLLVTALLAVALFTPARWVLLVLALDFAVKVFARFRYSPLCTVSRLISNALGLPARPVDAAPKRFAAALGLIFCSAGLVLGPLLGQWPAYAVVVGVFAFCAALEGFAGFCVGCVMYQAIVQRRPGLLRASRQT
jgi:hypothetical protein